MTAPFSDADVEVVDRAMRDANSAQPLTYNPIAHYARAALDALAGRLLPAAPVETTTEWGVWWHGEDPAGIVMSEEHMSNRQWAERVGQERIGQYGIRSYTVRCCEHRKFADGSVWISGWVKAPASQQTTEERP